MIIGPIITLIRAIIPVPIIIIAVFECRAEIMIVIIIMMMITFIECRTGAGAHKK